MEQLYSNLSNLGYDGPVDSEMFSTIFTSGAPTLNFVDVVAWLSSQLVLLCGLENDVTAVNDEEDLGAKAIGFLVEVSSLLKELGCPIKRLTRGPVEERLIEPGDKLSVILYLVQELQAGKILAYKKPAKKEPVMKIELEESITAKEIREMLVSLNFGKPPDNITPQRLFGEVEKKLYTLSQPGSPKNIVGQLLFSGSLTEKQWFQLEKLFKEVHHEYRTRRNLLLTRLDVTIKSFLWADRLKNKSDDILNNYNKRRSEITDDPVVKISDILSAAPELAVVEKTSSASVRLNTKSFINKHTIGPVPDRGGRPEEQKPPPPEVPSWQKTDNSSRGGSRQSFQHSSNNFRGSGDRGSYRNRNENDNRSNNDNYRNTSYNNNKDPYQKGMNEFQPVYQPVYQPVQCFASLGPQLGFGGYMPAGDNFSQFGGVSDGMQHQYVNSGPKQYSGGHDRGGGRGGFRGRGRGGRGRGYQ